MLNPEYLSELPEEILKLFAEVEVEILADMARRIAKYDFWIPSADYQNQKLLEAGILQEDILQILSAVTRKSEAELRRMMQEAGSMSLKADGAVYEAAGLNVPSIKDSEPLKAILNTGYKATAQTMRNLCRTTANAAARQFESVLDAAWLKVQSGAFSADTAIRDAIKTLSEQGVQAIRYRSGRTDSLEVAVRRAVVTGVNQTSAQLQEELADELECDLVEVSAHSGARPEHAKWQGKIFSRSGTHPKYPDFKSETGYGTGAGLCGWNCRHTFGPYIEGSAPVWSEEALAELDKPKYEYNGEQLTEYEAEQQQRYHERQIRRWKREEIAMHAAGLDSSEAAAKVKYWQGVQADFIEQTGFARQYERENVTAVKLSGVDRVKVENNGTSKLAAPSEIANDWSQTIARKMTKEERGKLAEYANSKGINLINIKGFDGDPEIFKSEIDTISKISAEYEILGKITVAFNSNAPDDEFASVRNRVITFNAKALRDRKITEANIRAGNKFASSNVDDIAAHEMGHIIASIKGNRGLDISRKAYYNVFGVELSDDAMLEYLSDHISMYSITYYERMGGGQSYNPKRYSEIISEVVAKNNSSPDAFTTEFTKLLKEL